MKRKKVISLFYIAVLLITGCAKGNSSSSDLLTSQSELVSQSSTDPFLSESEEPSSTESSPSSETPSLNEETSTSDSAVVSETPPSSEVPVTSKWPVTSQEPTSEVINPYYTSINNADYGVNLRSSLKRLITDTHKKETTYSGLKSVFEVADADPKKSGNIIWFYSGTSVKFSGFGSSNGATNREHVWPKAAGKAFPAETKAGSDGHHLRPTETQLNSIRGDKSFGIVPQTSANIAAQNGSTTYATGDFLSYKDSTYFYPGKGFRGQTARILFYVQVRWGNEYNLKFVLGSGSVKTIGDIETLMKWHLEEPVSESERLRNQEVFKIQGNRNPFIDVPDYACNIYARDGESYNTKVSNVCAAR